VAVLGLVSTLVGSARRPDATTRFRWKATRAVPEVRTRDRAADTVEHPVRQTVGAEVVRLGPGARLRPA